MVGRLGAGTRERRIDAWDSLWRWRYFINSSPLLSLLVDDIRALNLFF